MNVSGLRRNLVLKKKVGYRGIKNWHVVPGFRLAWGSASFDDLVLEKR